MKTESLKMKEILSECVNTINSFIQKIDDEEKKEQESKDVEMPEYNYQFESYLLSDKFQNLLDDENSEYKKACLNKKYAAKMVTLSNLLLLRDWVWDNMEGGYRPKIRANTIIVLSCIVKISDSMQVVDLSGRIPIFHFKFHKTAEMFLAKYKAALEEIKELI
jgi:hypothetical protein